MRNQLNALFGKIFTLVVLTGQKLYSKGSFACSQRQGFLYYIVNRRLGQHLLLSHGKLLIRQSHNVITVNNTHTGQGLHPQVVAQIGKQTMSLYGKGVLLFYKNSPNVTHIHSLQSKFTRLILALFVYILTYFGDLSNIQDTKYPHFPEQFL